MRVDRTALNRDEIPFIDLHQERRAQQSRVYALNARRLFAVVVVIMLQLGVLLPLTLQALAFRPRIAQAQQRLAETERSLQAVTQASNQLAPILQHTARYQQSQTGRGQIQQAFAALALYTPPGVYIEQVEVEKKDKQVLTHLQGIAQTPAALGDFVAAMARTPEFAHLHLTETTFARVAERREVHFRAETAGNEP